MFIFKNNDSEGSVLSIKELANFLNRDISSVYNSIRILKKKKTKDLVLKDSAGEKHLIITEDELNGKVWYK
jgi:predicted transcriptional regulator